MKKVLYGTWVAIRTAGRAIGAAGRAAVVLVGIAGIMLAHADYLATVPGTGTGFASKVISTVHHAALLLCDATLGEAQCVAVDNTGNMSVKDTALLAAVQAATPINKNGSATAATGATPGTAQTGTQVNQDVGVNAVGNTAAGTFGTPPAAVPALPVNAYPTLGTLALGSTFVSGTTTAMTGTAATQVIALVASKRLYATRVSCKGDPANAVGTKVQITDGNAGTVLDTLTVAPNGGGEQATGVTPLFWTTAGNALFAQNVTTGASVICTGSGYSG